MRHIENLFDDLLGGSEKKQPPSVSAPQSRSKAAASKQPRQTRPTLVRESELADFWGVTPRQVRMLVSERKIEKLKSGEFDLKASTQRYIAALIASAKLRATPHDLAGEKLRLTQAQAEKVELQNAAVRGELLPAGEVRAAWSEILRDVRAAMLAVPSRAAQRLPHLAQTDLETIDREIRDALLETAQDGHD